MEPEDDEVVMVPCPYCGRLIEEDTAEAPADYCHHD